MKEEKKLGKILVGKGWKIAVAESCTGGRLADRITDVPGSSRYFLGGIVAYHNDAKINLLDVPEEILEQFGAVSAETAKAMAAGARKALGADLAVSTTGIAGPSGGTEEKPVGLVYLGLAVRNGSNRHFKRVWEGDRMDNKNETVREALSLLIAELQEIE